MYTSKFNASILQCSIPARSARSWHHTRADHPHSRDDALRMCSKFIDFSNLLNWKRIQHPAMVRAVSSLKARGETTFLCLSNANSVFIDTILKVPSRPRIHLFTATEPFSPHSPQHKGLENLYEEIITNPAEWDPSGLLKVRRRIDPEGPQHSCHVGCSPNMCKGMLCLVPERNFESHFY